MRNSMGRVRSGHRISACLVGTCCLITMSHIVFGQETALDRINEAVIEDIDVSSSVEYGFYDDIYDGQPEPPGDYGEYGYPFQTPIPDPDPTETLSPSPTPSTNPSPMPTPTSDPALTLPPTNMPTPTPTTSTGNIPTPTPTNPTANVPTPTTSLMDTPMPTTSATNLPTPSVSPNDTVTSSGTQQPEMTSTPGGPQITPSMTPEMSANQTIKEFFDSLCPDILDALNKPEFTSLIQVIDSVGDTPIDKLTDDIAVLVAPNNDAFGSLNKDLGVSATEAFQDNTLVLDILRVHVGLASSVDDKEIQTLAGSEISIFYNSTKQILSLQELIESENNDLALLALDSGSEASVEDVINCQNSNNIAILVRDVLLPEDRLEIVEQTPSGGDDAEDTPSNTLGDSAFGITAAWFNLVLVSISGFVMLI